MFDIMFLGGMDGDAMHIHEKRGRVGVGSFLPGWEMGREEGGGGKGGDWEGY